MSEASGEMTAEQEEALRARASGGLQDYAAKMHDKAFKTADELLSPRPTARQLIDVAADVEQAIDNQVYRFAGKLEVLHQQGVSPEIACKKGCAFCCGTQITSTVPEALRIAQWMIENYTDEEMAAFKARLAAFIPRAQAARASGGSRPPIDCPILENAACTAHPARPLSCRGANSLSAEACAFAREHWDDPTLNIPLVGQPLYAAKAIVSGVKQALENRGIPCPIVEMPLALDVILNNPNAAEQFLAGDPIFECAIA